MTITTLQGVKDGLLPPYQYFKGVQGQNTNGFWQSCWFNGNYPVTGAFDNTLNGVALSAPQTGAVPFQNPASGRTYLARLTAKPKRSDVIATFSPVLCDRLWHNGNIDLTSTSLQPISSPAFPARDENGQTNGQGILIGLEIESVVGSATTQVTLGYKNSAGTTGRTAQLVHTPNGGAAGTFYPFALAAGDRGVRAVESIQLSSSWVSGTVHLVAYRVVAMMNEALPQVRNTLDAISLGFPRLFDDSVLFFMVVCQSTSGLNGPSGEIQFAQG